MWREGLTVAMILSLATCGQSDTPYTLQAETSRSVELTQSLCVDEETRERIRALMLEGLDTALKEHIVRMFEVWMRDERGQPDRAKVGVRQGIRAYMGARTGALEWMPPICPG